MLFSSLLFLYAFLPIVLVVYYLLEPKFRNTFLLFASIIFYAWGGISYTGVLLASMLINYLFGRAIYFNQNNKNWLIAGIVFNILMIGVFKYADFILQSINIFLPKQDIKTLGIVLPIGISFYTFQAVSYLIDVYKNKAYFSKNIINTSLFIALFPQLIAGPIVRYHDISEQLKKRTHTIDKFYSGIIRFTIGLGKKVLIANNMAIMADYAFAETTQLSTPIAFLGVISYTLQIYYDFSGYSDMAIGLGRMFGFEILENFKIPYIAKSIQDFWRRWHISLSSWFRDYLYIPLGGNRLGEKRTIINLYIVFAVTGLWHGASWTFVCWGLLHGTMLFIERIGFHKILQRLPSIIQHFYTLVFVMVAWVLFRADTFEKAWLYIVELFSFNFEIPDFLSFKILLNREYLFYLLIGTLGALGTFTGIEDSFLLKRTNNWKKQSSSLIAALVFIAIIFLLSTSSLVNNLYNPFIYFRF